MDRQIDLIFRLFCVGQLFECIRPYVLRGVVSAWETDGAIAALSAFFDASPPARWAVYIACLVVVTRGPKRGAMVALAGAHLLDIALSIATNSLSSGYAEKGILVLVSVGAAGLLLVEGGKESEGHADRLRAFLRGASGIGFAFVALNKTNADFLDPLTSCSKVLADGLFQRIPFLEPILSPIMGSPWVPLAQEALLLPMLLIHPRIGVIYVWVFFIGVGQVGPRATCFIFMALALCFLPGGDLGRIDWRSRTIRRTTLACAVLATAFWTVMLALTREVTAAQLLSRALFLTLGLLGLGLAVANLATPHEPRASAFSALRSGPRTAQIVAASVLTLLLLNELSPYLGIKSKYSLTMWSNLRADAGLSNSLVFPESLRVSGHADRSLLRISPLARHDGTLLRPGERGFTPFVAARASALAHLRGIEKRRGTVRFEVLAGDDDRHTFEGAGPRSGFADFVERTRPAVDWFDGRVMTLDRPQSCLGP